jgi:hypothetical protein
VTRLWSQGEEIEVEINANGQPRRFLWAGEWRIVDQIANRWRVQSTWWQRDAAAHRDYYKLTTAGLLCVIFRDLPAGPWFLGRLYD